MNKKILLGFGYGLSVSPRGSYVGAFIPSVGSIKEWWDL